MILLNFVSILLLTSVALATPGQRLFSDEELVSSPIIRELLERVNRLEKRDAEQVEEIQTLRAELVHQRGDMVKVRTILKAKDNTIQSLLHRLIASETDRSFNSEHISGIQTRQAASSPEETVKQTRGEINRIRRQVDNEVNVAFSAGLSTHLLNVGDNQTVKFDHVITNVGNSYNPHFGSFIAPVAGIYVFSTSILTYDSRDNWACLAVNGVQKSKLFMHDDRHAMSSQTMVFELNKGDDVGVLGRAGDAFHGVMPPFTTFTGFLLQQNYVNAGNIVG